MVRGAGGDYAIAYLYRSFDLGDLDLFSGRSSSRRARVPRRLPPPAALVTADKSASTTPKTLQ